MKQSAPVVRQIYSLCLAGNGPTKIARMLTEQRIPSPGTLDYKRTGSTRRYSEKVSYKVKHSTINREEKQAVFENDHEPIIDRETWEQVLRQRPLSAEIPDRKTETGLLYLWQL